MQAVRGRNTAVITTAAALFALAALVAWVARGDGSNAQPAFAAKQLQGNWQGAETGGAGGEAFESLTAATQFAEARTAPSGIVQPGAYSAAYGQLTGLPTAGAAWSNITRGVKYDADDIEYRDYYSNSSGGSGNVTGRVTGLAADNAGNVYAAGAMGGVWRSTTGGGNWTPIADSLPTLSSGTLELDGSGALWYATGEANTGGTSYAGTGVYVLRTPTTGTFSHPGSRVGGTELESTTINQLRFGSNDRVWAATNRGVYWHSTAAADQSKAWTLSYQPNPAAIGQGTNTNAPYKNIVNDIAVDPTNANHVIAAIGWRSGDTYNGFYETTDGGTTWTKTNPAGAINANDIGNVTFAWSSNGKKLYAINQSPALLNKLTGTVNSYLDGIYVSTKGIAGPWNKVAEQTKLANAGSALKQSVGGKGYGPGIQAWYNQFLVVDPRNEDHVFAGLEEVYETKNAGSTWTTPGAYWNFYFSCWNVDAVYNSDTGEGNRCPLSTHSDQHSAAIGKVGGTYYLFVGNDGGIYRRPLDGKANANGQATDWKSLNDGTIDSLQYYAVDVGKAQAGNKDNPAGTGDIVSGGLQDNGGSILRLGGPKMSSNFGGDGGDVLVDPENGCNIVQEYTVLAMRVTNTCASPTKADGTPNLAAWLDYSQTTTFSIAPPDVNARFIAPFVGNSTNTTQWLAGGATIWYQDKGFAIRSGSEWKAVHSWGSAARTTTAMAYTGKTAIAAWCGGCNNAGFARGAGVGTFDAAAKTWSWKNLDLAGVPTRYVGGVAIDPTNENHLFLALNGFSRRFTEGPGAGVGHIYESTDRGATWKLADGTGAGAFPDVPANSIQVLKNGALVVGTDLAVLYRAPGSTSWSRLGTNFPATVAMDVELSPSGTELYAATHGRGLWRIALP
jgi:hypothetical protein